MHRILELFALERNDGSSRLARVDVRVKLAIALAAILAVVLSTRVGLPLATLACSLTLLVACGAPLRITLLRLAAPLGMAAAICLLQAVMTGKTPLAVLDLGFGRLVVSREGLAAGALIAARVLGSVSVIVVLCSFTPAHEILAALRWAKLPRTWVEIALLMVRAIFTLFEQAGAVLAAQRVRLGHATLRRSLCSIGSLAGIVLLRSLDQAQRTHEAMTVRGYQGRLPIPRLRPLAAREWAACCGGVTAIALVFVLLERWPL
jgi:cobalt/nickel transport system permease protein